MNSYTYIIPAISCAAYITLIAVTIFFAQRRVRDTFLLYLCVAMMWSFFAFQLHWDSSPKHTLLWHKLVLIFFYAVPVAYYHFISTFTNRISIPRIVLGYILLIFISGLTLGGFVIESSEVIDRLLYFDLGIAIYIIAIFGLSFMFMAILNLVKSYRYSTDSQVRNSTVYLLGGAILVVILSLTNLYSDMSKYPIDHAGNLVNAIVITYVVVKFQLLDIRVVIRRGLSYSGLTIFITAIYLLLLLILQMFIESWAGYSSLALAALFAFVLAILFNPLRNVFQEWVDRLFYRETYDYRRMLLSFSNKASNILDLEELSKEMLYPVTQALYVSWASLLISETENSDFATQFARQANEEPSTKLRFSRDNPIVTWLTREGKPLRRELIEILPEFKGLWAGEMDDLRASEVELLFPIKSKGNLIGILALGRKRSNNKYSSEDIDLLMTIVGSSAIAIENARVLDTLKKEQLQVRRLLSQTVQAQEDERRRISVELHDSVTQWLVGASYRIQVCNSLLSKSNNNGEVRNELGEVEKTMDQSLKELRRVMRGLHPPALAELGLTHALQQLIDQLESKGIACIFETTGKSVRLHSSVEITIFRIVQEALNNIQKHAGATYVEVRLDFKEDDVFVEIGDNGRGFNLSQTLDSAILLGSLGLLGMKQRAETIGATLEVDTEPGSGTRIVLRCPLLLDTYEGALGDYDGGKK